MDRKSLYDRIALWGSAFTPDMLGGTMELYAPLVMRPEEERVLRDIAYGSDERHRLDVFRPGTDNAPVLVFVHGGGFVRGDKGGRDDPFYNNVGAWAARSGFVGVTMTYRLAPTHQWPAGGEDVLSAVRWLKANIAEHGGDPDRVFVMGQSAGAAHVAEAVRRSSPGDFSGALMISGIYDVVAAGRSELHDAYYGTDENRFAQQSTMPALGETQIPCLFSISEYDPPEFQSQAAMVVEARLQATRHWPEMHWLAGHNHLSSVSQMGTEHDTLGPLIADFIERHGP
ncbi:alpha/beta hydrolase [Altericroceibacterium xinjiangense]|uniref:alpha/beta hydrolase n=1 Tax=Altericroceibacterium xinjiangense TaxID=762261 RepID=UPI000F7F9504|nr:alpha/beta hydrolase [Altericroceibacterium xinjiangense]